MVINVPDVEASGSQGKMKEFQLKELDVGQVEVGMDTNTTTTTTTTTTMAKDNKDSIDHENKTRAAQVIYLSIGI